MIASVIHIALNNNNSIKRLDCHLRLLTGPQLINYRENALDRGRGRRQAQDVFNYQCNVAVLHLLLFHILKYVNPSISSGCVVCSPFSDFFGAAVSVAKMDIRFSISRSKHTFFSILSAFWTTAQTQQKHSMKWWYDSCNSRFHIVKNWEPKWESVADRIDSSAFSAKYVVHSQIKRTNKQTCKELTVKTMLKITNFWLSVFFYRALCMRHL